jgi:glutamate 5-kinase
MEKIVVIKIGTSLLTNQDGKIKASFIADVCEDMGKICAKGWKPIIVSSGAMASGKGIIEKEDCSMEERHLLSAVGQPRLMSYWGDFLRIQGIVSAQCLLTWNNFENTEESNILKENLKTMLSSKIIPIVNENDFVSDNELGGGDNDTLAAKVSALLGAEKLLILSDVDGLYTASPHDNPDAKKIETVEKITDEIWGYIGEKKSKNSLGGMKSKIEAAEIATSSGTQTIIFEGVLGGYNIPKILLEKGNVGTRFLAK